MKTKVDYIDFAIDEAQYLFDAFSKGLRYNAMVSQAQRVCEGYMKQVITKSLMNASDVMMSHNLRELYDYIASMGINISSIRNEVMTLNNFHTHTRYPGRDAYIAQVADIENAVNSLTTIAQCLAPIC